MILKKMILPGRFVQAHPYFDTLWLVRMDGTLQAFDTERYVTKMMNGSGSAAAKAFARNDRLVTNQGIAHLRDQTPDVEAFLTSGMDVEVSPKDLERFSYTFEREDMLEEPSISSSTPAGLTHRPIAGSRYSARSAARISMERLSVGVARLRRSWTFGSTRCRCRSRRGSVR